jgi:hypothetical protein
MWCALFLPGQIRPVYVMGSAHGDGKKGGVRGIMLGEGTR